jgi:hypothetical protein
MFANKSLIAIFADLLPAGFFFASGSLDFSLLLCAQAAALFVKLF